MLRTIQNFIVLLVSFLFALQLRTQLPIGDTFAPTPGILMMGFAGSAAIVGIVFWLGRRLSILDVVLADRHAFRKYTICLVLFALLLLLYLPDSLLLAYTLAIGAVMGVLNIAVPVRMYAGQAGVSLRNDFRKLWEARWLYQLWLRSNIETRYSQRILGILWIVLIPLSTAIVLSLAFTQFMRVQLDVPFIAFYLAGIVSYNVFSNGVLNGSVAVLARISLITQVYFPREVLVLLALGELLIDFAVMFAAMLVINAFFGVFPNVYFIYLPILTLILVAITFGAMMLTSALTVLVRDVPQLLSVFLQAFFFLTPVIYPVDIIAEDLRFLFLINPIAPLVQGFRDVIVYARPIELLTLAYPAAVALVLVMIGYATFKSTESIMADYL